MCGSLGASLVVVSYCAGESVTGEPVPAVVTSVVYWGEVPIVRVRSADVAKE